MKQAWSASWRVGWIQRSLCLAALSIAALLPAAVEAGSTAVPCPSNNYSSFTYAASAYQCAPTFDGCVGTSVRVTVLADCVAQPTVVHVNDCRWGGVSTFAVVYGSSGADVSLLVRGSSIATTTNAWAVDASGGGGSLATVSNVTVHLDSSEAVVAGGSSSAACVGCVLLSSAVTTVRNVTLVLRDSNVSYTGASTSWLQVVSVMCEVTFPINVSDVSLQVVRSNVVRSAPAPASPVAWLSVATLYLYARLIARTPVSVSRVRALIHGSTVIVTDHFAAGSSILVATFGASRVASISSDVQLIIGGSSVIAATCSDTYYCNVFVASFNGLGPGTVSLRTAFLTVTDDSAVTVLLRGSAPNFGVAAIDLWHDMGPETIVAINNLTAIVDRRSRVFAKVSTSSVGGAVVGIWSMSITVVTTVVSLTDCTFIAASGANLRVEGSMGLVNTGYAAAGAVFRLHGYGSFTTLSNVWFMATGASTIVSAGLLGRFDDACAVVGIATWANSVYQSINFTVFGGGALLLAGANASINDSPGHNDLSLAVVGFASRQFNSVHLITVSSFLVFADSASIVATPCTGYNCAIATCGVAIFKNGPIAIINVAGVIVVARNASVTVLPPSGNAPSYSAHAAVGVAATFFAAASGTSLILQDIAVGVAGSTVRAWGGPLGSTAAGGVSCLLSPQSSTLLRSVFADLLIAASDSVITATGPELGNRAVVSALGVSISEVVPRLVMRNVTIMALRSTITAVANTASNLALVADGLTVASAGVSLQAATVHALGVRIRVCGSSQVNATVCPCTAVSFTAAAAGIAVSTTDAAVAPNVLSDVELTVTDHSTASVQGTPHKDSWRASAVGGVSVSTDHVVNSFNITNVRIAVTGGSTLTMSHSANAGPQAIACGVAVPGASVPVFMANISVEVCDSRVTSTLDAVAAVVAAGNDAPVTAVVLRSVLESLLGRCAYGTPMLGGSVVGSSALNCTQGVGASDGALGGAVAQWNVTTATPVAQWGFRDVTEVAEGAVAARQCTASVSDCADAAASLVAMAMCMGEPFTQCVRTRTASLVGTVSIGRTATQTQRLRGIRSRTQTRAAAAPTPTSLPPTTPSRGSSTLAPPAVPNATLAPTSIASSPAPSTQRVLHRTPTRTVVPRLTTLPPVSTSQAIVRVDAAVPTAAAASAVVGVLSPSAASRPSRLAATAQLADCNYDASSPSLVVFPIQPSLGAAGAEGMLLGSSVLWTCVIAALACAMVAADRLSWGAKARQWLALGSALTASYFGSSVVSACMGLAVHSTAGAGVRVCAAVCVVVCVAVACLQAWLVVPQVRKQGPPHA